MSIIVNSNKDVEANSKEDRAAMNALLKLPSDSQAWEQQQQRRSSFKSASLTHGINDKAKNGECKRCGDQSRSHNEINCPFSV